MKKHIYRIGILCAFLAIAYSCQTDDEKLTANEENVVATQSDLLLEQMSGLITRPTQNGSLLLSSHKVISEFNTPESIALKAKNDSRNINKSNDGQTLLIKDHSGVSIGVSSTNRAESKRLTSLYGTTVKLVTSGGTRANGNTEEVYLPDLLSDINVDRNTLEVGTTITWNVDSLNENGLLFHISYDPKIQKNFRIAYDNQFRVAESFAVTDASGSYTIQASDLERFPNDAQLKVTLMRGAISAGEGNEPSFIAISEASVNTVVKR